MLAATFINDFADLAAWSRLAGVALAFVSTAFISSAVQRR